MALSNRSTKEPTDDTQPVSRHSLTYFHSLPPSWGTHKGTKPSGAAPGSNRIRAWAESVRMVSHPLNGAAQAVFQGDDRPPIQQARRQRRVGQQAPDFARRRPGALAFGFDDDRF